MMRSFKSILVLSVCHTAVVTGFVATGRSNIARVDATPARRRRTAQERPAMMMMILPDDGGFIAASSTWLIATIDSDISKIPDNEFAPVFLGGMAVMLGGVLSAAFVGTVVDQKNLYGELVMDSYMEGRNDEAFWKGLTDEERVKVKGLLERMQEGDNDSRQELEGMMAQKMAAVDSTATTASVATTTARWQNGAGYDKEAKGDRNV